MRSIFIVLISLFALLVFNNDLSAQSQVDPKWSQKYQEPTMVASDIIKAMDKYKFKPAIRKVDERSLKTALLQFEADEIKQLNISSWYLCSTKHDDYFTIWNMYYTKISKSDWDQNCKELISLMIIDGTAKAR